MLPTVGDVLTLHVAQFGEEIDLRDITPHCGEIIDGFAVFDTGGDDGACYALFGGGGCCGGC